MSSLLLAFCPQVFQEVVVDPAEPASPNGEYVFHVDPGRRDGGGPGQVTLRHGDEELWSRTLPFTLVQAEAMDAGSLVGYALTNSEQFGGELLVAVLDRGGKLVLDHRTRLEMSQFMRMPENPLPLGLVVEPEPDRFAVRIADPDVNRRVESWWRFRLSDGTRLEELKPSERLKIPDLAWFHEQQAEPLGAAGLSLLHRLVCRERDDRHASSRYGASFALMDAAGELVWRLDLPDDYTVEGNDDGTSALLDRVREEGALLDPSASDRFHVRSFREGQELEFEARSDGAAPNGWNVKEIDRRPWVSEPPPIEPEGAVVRTLDAVEGIALDVGAVGGSGPFEGLVAWTFDGEGGFMLVRRDPEKRFVRVRMDAHGTEFESHPFDPLPAELETSWGPWHPLGDDRWLLGQGEFGEAGVPTRLFLSLARNSTSAQPIPTTEPTAALGDSTAASC